MNPRRPSRSGFAGGGGPARRPDKRFGGRGRAELRAARSSPGRPSPPRDAVFEGPCAVPSLPVRPAGAGKRHSMFFVESAHSLLVLICREGRRYECRKAASFAGPTADGVPAGAGVSVVRRTGNRAGSAGRSSPPRKYFFGNADAGRTDAAPAVVEAENNKMIRTTEIQTDQ